MPLAAASPPRLRSPGRRTPTWAAAARGAHLWDAQGRRHLDMGCAAGAALLGHAEPRVEAAAASPRPYAEAAACEALLFHVPGADTVRFCADAEAALAAAVALAVRATDRTEVLRLDASDDMAALAPRIARGDVAAVVLAYEAGRPPRLRETRMLTQAHGALLILDRTVCGLRRGPESSRGVWPDLTVFGAEMANGWELGALAGDAALLAHMPDGPPPRPAALAAAAATLVILAREPVASHLTVRGGEIEAELESLLLETGAAALARVVGDPAWITVEIVHPDARRLERRLVAQLAARGVHAPGPLAVSYRHEDAEVAELLDAMAACLPWLAAASRADAA